MGIGESAGESFIYVTQSPIVRYFRKWQSHDRFGGNRKLPFLCRKNALFPAFTMSDREYFLPSHTNSLLYSFLKLYYICLNVYTKQKFQKVSYQFLSHLSESWYFHVCRAGGKWPISGCCRRCLRISRAGVSVLFRPLLHFQKRLGNMYIFLLFSFLRFICVVK